MKDVSLAEYCAKDNFMLKLSLYHSEPKTKKRLSNHQAVMLTVIIAVFLQEALAMPHVF